MKASVWSPITAMWLIFGVAAAIKGQYLTSWMALLCCGLAVLSAIVDKVHRRELRRLESHNRILAARVRLYEKETVERRRSH